MEVEHRAAPVLNVRVVEMGVWSQKQLAHPAAESQLLGVGGHNFFDIGGLTPGAQDEQSMRKAAAPYRVSGDPDAEGSLDDHPPRTVQEAAIVPERVM